MLSKTSGIVLRTIKYGETSLVTNIFTSEYGVQTYLVQGVRSEKQSKNRSAFFQPAMLLDLVVYHHEQKTMQRIREFTAAHIYTSVQEHVIKNSIAIFSAELLLRLLPENAPQKHLYDKAVAYFLKLDSLPLDAVANFPLYFIVECSRVMGYELKGSYSDATPYLNLQEGGFTDQPPPAIPFTSDEDARMLSGLLDISELEMAGTIKMNGDMRLRLMDWYIAFLHQHTQHMGSIKSLTVLRAILH
ncbi:MAG: DNA repair protein RecO [Bacteroidota bacterium]